MTGPERAREDLAEVLRHGRVEIDDAMRAMAERGHPPTRVRRASRRLEVRMIREGPPGTKQRFWWELPDICPTCMRSFALAGDRSPAMWGSYRGVDGDYWAEQETPTVPELPQLEPRREVVERIELEPSGPPRCNVCGMAAAGGAGELCPYWPRGVKCPGRLQ